MPRPKKTPPGGVTDDQAQERLLAVSNLPATAKPARKKSPRKPKAQAPGAQDNGSWAFFGLYETNRSIL